MSQNNDTLEYETCCYCGDYINPSSQCCGRCARLGTGHVMGWNSLPSYMQPEHDLFQYRNDNYQGLIYYTGIGSTPQTEYMTELQFRKLMHACRNDFNKELPYDPHKCSLRLLVNWVGAVLTPN